MENQTHLPEDIIEVAFEVGGFFDGMKLFCLKVTEEGSTLTKSSWLSPEVEETKLSYYETTEMLRKIIDLKTENWRKHYNHPGVLDGTQWSFTITYKGENPVEYGGSNAYPSKWDDLCAIFGYEFLDEIYEEYEHE